MYVLAIDNGYKGFACLMRGPSFEHSFISTPLCSPPLICPELYAVEFANKTGYDFRKMVQIAKAAYRKSGGNCKAIIEDTISTHGGHRFANQTSAKSRDALMVGKTAWCCACIEAGIRPFTVAPRRWQAKMGLLNKDKDDAVAMAIGLGANLPMVGGTKRSKAKPSHDAADAYLLARWFLVHSPQGMNGGKKNS